MYYCVLTYSMLQYVLTAKGFMGILVDFRGCFSSQTLIIQLGVKQGGKYTLKLGGKTSQ